MPAATHGSIRLERRRPVHPLRQLATYGRLARPRPGAEPRPWLIYGQGRSGSTLLGELVGSHPDAVFEDEILYRPVSGSSRWWAEARRRGHPDLAFGFHVKPYQLSVQHGVGDQHGWLQWFTDRGWLVVHLSRRNALRQALSSAVSAHAGQAFLRDGDADRRRPIRVEPQQVIDAMAARLAARDVEAAALRELPHQPVVYETDLVGADRHQATATRIHEELGLSPHRVITSLRPTARHPRDQFENWDEVRAAVAASAFAHHLEEVER